MPILEWLKTVRSHEDYTDVGIPRFGVDSQMHKGYGTSKEVIWSSTLQTTLY
jgi:hypothetical protein